MKEVHAKPLNVVKQAAAELVLHMAGQFLRQGGPEIGRDSQYRHPDQGEQRQPDATVL
ncbi:MAG: hypothetical protein PF795_11145 [Kiritimatiellae bacterium]|nr:hypothetical protein [Kiritimatiellia bacterium]